MIIEEIIIIIWLHFVADFILQSDKMALNKSSNNRWLCIHSICYSIPFLYFGLTYCIINGMLHFSIDYITSRITGYLYQKEERHWFFVMIGLDQAAHLSCLILLLNI